MGREAIYGESNAFIVSMTKTEEGSDKIYAYKKG